MSDLLKKSISVRGKSYVVTELDAQTAIDLRKHQADGGQASDALVAERCCEDPKLTAAAVAKMPNAVIRKIAQTAMDLGAEESPAKNA